MKATMKVITLALAVAMAASIATAQDEAAKKSGGQISVTVLGRAILSAAITTRSIPSRTPRSTPAARSAAPPTASAAPSLTTAT